MRIITFLIVVSLASISQAVYLRNSQKTAEDVGHDAIKSYHEDEAEQNEEQYKAVMNRFLDHLSNEVGEEKAQQFIKDVAQMIQENDVDAILDEIANTDNQAKKDFFSLFRQLFRGFLGAAHGVLHLSAHINGDEKTADERLYDEFNFDDVTSNQVRGGVDTNMKETDAQINEDDQLMQLLHSLKQFL